MNETVAVDPHTEDALTHEALVDRYIEGMNRLHEQMAEDRQEILRLQAETRAILDDVMTTLKWHK
jgi:hypothetical protein